MSTNPPISPTSESIEEAKLVKPPLYVVQVLAEEADIPIGNDSHATAQDEAPGPNTARQETGRTHAEASGEDTAPQADATLNGVGPQIIPLDITGDGESPRDRFLGIAAVLECDFEELDLLQRIWNLKQSNQARFEDLEDFEEGIRAQWARVPAFMPTPAYVHTLLKNAISTAKTILALVEDLDRYRHGVIREWVFQFGADRCPVPVSKHGYTLPGSDRYLGALIEEESLYLDRFGKACLEQANLLRGLDGPTLEGKLRGMRIAVNRMKWEEPFRGHATFVERSTRSLRNALKERAASLARGPMNQVEKAANERSAFAIAPGVTRAARRSRAAAIN